jgi:hypothetical protein
MPVADSSFGAVYSSMEDEFHHYFYARIPRTVQKIKSKTNNKKK